MHFLYERVTFIFERLHGFWTSGKTRTTVNWLLVISFLGSLIIVELGRRDWLPAAIAGAIPRSHFHAVDVAFTLVLMMEVVDLVFVLPCSVSKSVGKQLEILSLILLRNAFKQLIYLPEPVDLTGNLEPLYHILAYGVASVVIFALLGVYFSIHRHKPVLKEGMERYRFVATKKMIALFLLVFFVVTGFYDIYLIVRYGEGYGFFELFYTALIFSDILIVLISQRYLPTYHAVFRNSGYALSTLMMRLALTAPVYIDGLIGVGAAVFAVGLTLAYNEFNPKVFDSPYDEPERVEHDPCSM